MSDNLTEKIINFFNEIGCPAKTILKNGLKGEQSFYDYYIINDGKEILMDDKKYDKLLKFEEVNEIYLLTFYLHDCNPVEKLISEFEEDSFKVIYKS